MADLVSRKPKTDSNDAATAVALKTIALEYKPDAEEAHPAAGAPDAVQSVEPPAAPAGDVAPEPPSDLEPASEPAAATPAIADEIPKATGELLETTAAPVPVEVKGEPGPTRAKKIVPVAEPAAFEDQADEAGPALAAGPKSILDEMAELDADVAALRRQLAKKLAEQNAQLRKMLARFDAR